MSSVINRFDIPATDLDRAARFYESVLSVSLMRENMLGVDAPRLQRFYADLFGWKVTLNPAGYGYVPVARAPPVALTGGIGRSPQGQPLTIFDVKVADPAATLKRAQALGGRIAMPPVEVPGGIIFARLADPEGNIVGIVRRAD